MVKRKEQEYDFWPDAVAKELVSKWKGKQVIVTGTSMSGDPHIGNANDVIRGDAVRLAVKDLKKPVELVWISDDMDPFRSVPTDLPKELENYLGIPASSIPDFWRCHKSFTAHFEDKFLKQLEKANVKPRALFGIDMYKKGMYNKVMKTAIEKRKEIANIINKYRTTPLPEDWYPIDVICQKCGKIATTKIISYNKKKSEVEYICDSAEILLHRKNPVAGCGNKSNASVLNGNTKLTWRVEWPARWVFLKATCEPFGKEHAAAGGSWDTAKEIVKLLGYKPPYPIVYEHFLVNGEKMSKSKGNVITVDDMLNYMKSAHLRYWMFQGRLTIAKDINLNTMLPHLFDEFDKAERIFFGREKSDDKKRDNNYKRAYELAVVNPRKTKLFDVPYEKLAELLMMAPAKNKIEFILSKLKELKFKITENQIKERIAYVQNWLQKFHKAERKEIRLDEKQANMIKKIISLLETESDPDRIQSKLFEMIKGSNIEIGDGFKLIYNIILNSDKGPRLGPYIMERGKEEIIKKLKFVL